MRSVETQHVSGSRWRLYLQALRIFERLIASSKSSGLNGRVSCCALCADRFICQFVPASMRIITPNGPEGFEARHSRLADPILWHQFHWQSRIKKWEPLAFVDKQYMLKEQLIAAQPPRR